MLAPWGHEPNWLTCVPLQRPPHAPQIECKEAGELLTRATFLTPSLYAGVGGTSRSALCYFNRIQHSSMQRVDRNADR